eukprot:CAMPEP_0184320180 /NCGR_PEP_ID=MMETSP1049-20130417/112697_1 /TAXON_ID=77928 /ORGANISM="Proteomonas sulcata, Strain CCMP704" /LENGTH=33 /DNA_ID= /DNA_START= /DNA_END= /DNA_ORIENTATION=
MREFDAGFEAYEQRYEGLGFMGLLQRWWRQRPP